MEGAVIKEEATLGFTKSFYLFQTCRFYSAEGLSM